MHTPRFRTAQSILALLRTPLRPSTASRPVRAFQTSSKMDSFFTQSPSWRHQPASGPFDFISRRSYGHTPYFVGPNRGVMRTVWTMIGINTVVFLAWQSAQSNKDARLQRRLHEETTLSEGNIQAGRGYTMITSAFSHKDLDHFIVNMFALHAYGRILSIIPGVGTIKFMSLAFGSAAAGSLAWLYHLRTKERPPPQRKGQTGIWSGFGGGQIVRHIYVGLGASGMVFGLGLAATCLAPMQRIGVMAVIPMPLWLVTSFLLGYETYAVDSNDTVGHAAHLGGAVFGAAFYFGLLRNYGGIWTMLRRGLR